MFDAREKAPLDQLSDRDRQVLVLFELEGRSGAGLLFVAMGCSSGAPMPGPGMACTDRCSTVQCFCTDGSSPGATECINGVCPDVNAACARVCTGHEAQGGGQGGGTAQAGGGGGSALDGGTDAGSREATYNQPCSSDATCPAYPCSCSDGTWVNNAQRCLGAHCAEPVDTCEQACGGHGGVVPLTADTAPTGKVYGCVLTRYASWLWGGSGATARIYGSGSTAQAGVDQAYARCMSWGYTSLFCADVSIWCVLESSAAAQCRLSVYSNNNGGTYTYDGMGAGESAARNDAEETCYGGGSSMWTYWGCTSQQVVCN